MLCMIKIKKIVIKDMYGLFWLYDLLIYYKRIDFSRMLKELENETKKQNMDATPRPRARSASASRPKPRQFIPNEVIYKLIKKKYK